jgi:FdhD protein
MADNTEINQQVNIERLTAGKREIVDADVVTEVTLTIFLNNKEIATLLCSPSALDFLAVGYLASAGLVSSRNDVRNVKLDKQHSTVHVETFKEISGESAKRGLSAGRSKGYSFYNFTDIIQGMKIYSEKRISAASIYKIVGEFKQQSNLNKLTAGSHCAALCDEETIVYFAADIDEHNALDKILGEYLMNGVESPDAIMVVSCEITSEILTGIARRHIGVVISNSAATDRAVSLANQANMTLVGLVGEDSMNIYTNSWRIDDAG